MNPERIALLVLVAAVAGAVALAVRAGLRPRPFRTTTGRRRWRERRYGRQRAAAAFARDLGLQVRMVIAMLAAAAVLTTVVGVLVTLAFTEWWPFAVFAVSFPLVGYGHLRGSPRLSGQARARPETAEDAARVESLVQRLCVLGGLAAPEVRIEGHTAPLSWTQTGWGGLRRIRRWSEIHVTTALLDRLQDAELEAVVAHELSHVAQRDALLMSVLATPTVAFFSGMRQMVREDPFRGACAILCYGLWLVPAAVVLSVLTRLVSRHRELTADRSAAILTGSPAAVAAALIAVAEGLTEVRRRDLRAVASHDVFHLLPSRKDEPGTLGQLWATHPRLHRRLAQLEEMEEQLHA
ncbi:MAG: hypothetical protein AVDCRST_MAG30-301 [uncultured Solirubrobacteraceae bacterium]|uniref:Peptidase M48 domain-containing protein n=1 Tax=uncultured Solirubrobacteraceae bacterium TaxID=1162706 RepID=A0A6J4RHQ6_9ACTN|nr:MAG: hypothetical protein AVDCRST_MAG30-301 [uncultured Solirubrobacteraceae bacterium]